MNTNVPLAEKSVLGARPTPGFEKPPYKAVQYGACGWAGVENAQGFNCLSFLGRPGVKFTSLEQAQRIAEDWNGEKREVAHG